MQTDIYSAAAALSTQEAIQEAVAFNVANLNTPGFKRRMVGVESFQPHLRAAMSKGEQRPLMPALQQKLDFAQGEIRRTGNPFDVALQGKGFFKVNIDGETRYTRNGSFQVNRGGEIVTSEGHRVSIVEGSGILQPNAGQITVSKDGSILQGGTKIGRYEIVDFEKPQRLIAGSRGFYGKPDTMDEKQADVTVVGEAIETSNVNPVEEFVAMIAVNRKFQVAQKVIEGINKILDRSSN